MLPLPRAPMARTLVKTVCRLPKPGGWSRIAAKGKILSLVFPVTRWKPRERRRSAARIVFFLARCLRRRQKPLSERHRALGGWPKSLARSPYPFSRSAGPPFPTPPVFFLLARLGARASRFFLGSP